MKRLSAAALIVLLAGIGCTRAAASTAGEKQSTGVFSASSPAPLVRSAEPVRGISSMAALLRGPSPNMVAVSG